MIVGDTKRLNFALESIDEVVVVAEAGTQLDTGYGFGTALTAQDIEQNVSVNRDLKDFIRLNPMVSLDDAQENYEAISIAGAHPRTIGFNRMKSLRSRLTETLCSISWAVKAVPNP